MRTHMQLDGEPWEQALPETSAENPVITVGAWSDTAPHSWLVQVLTCSVAPAGHAPQMQRLPMEAAHRP